MEIPVFEVNNLPVIAYFELKDNDTMKRIYMDIQGLHIVGTRKQIEDLSELCFRALNADDGKAQSPEYIGKLEARTVSGFTPTHILIED